MTLISVDGIWIDPLETTVLAQCNVGDYDEEIYVTVLPDLRQHFIDAVTTAVKDDLKKRIGDESKNSD